MSHAGASDIVENADIDRDTPQPEIHVEERRLKLKDYLKTLCKDQRLRSAPPRRAASR